MEIKKINNICIGGIVASMLALLFCMIFHEFIPIKLRTVGFIIGATIVSFGAILVNFNNDVREDQLKLMSFSVTLIFWYYGIMFVGTATNFYFLTVFNIQVWYPFPFLCAFMILAYFLDVRRKKAEEESKGTIGLASHI